MKKRFSQKKGFLLFGICVCKKKKKIHAFLPTLDDDQLTLDYVAYFTECKPGFSCLKTQSFHGCVKSAAKPSKYKNTD